MTFTATLKELKALEASGILWFKGFSGVPASVEMATAAPSMCQAHSLSGKRFDVFVKSHRASTFYFVEVQ